MKKVMFGVAMVCMMIMSMGTVWADVIMPGQEITPQRGAMGELAIPVSIAIVVLVIIVVLLAMFISKKNKNDEEGK